MQGIYKGRCYGKNNIMALIETDGKVQMVTLMPKEIELLKFEKESLPKIGDTVQVMELEVTIEGKQIKFNRIGLV